MVDSTNLPDVDINQIATDLNGKMDKDGVNATASVCVESWHDDNGNWYRVYSDGWCEQGGVGTSSNVNLLKNYVNTNFSAQVSWISMVSGSAQSLCVFSKTTSSIDVRLKWAADNSISTFNGGTFYWEAKGYIR